ncbi:MAG TPA: recombination mediator RecR [Kofleriaceae bacterium]
MADPIRRLVQELARLPGIGEKTATRLAFHLIRGHDTGKNQIRELAQALLDVTDKIRLCSVCMTMTESDPCPLCSDPRRDGETVCVVSSPSDLLAIDRGGHFRGTYHVLHGLLSPLEGIGPDDLRIAELIRRLNGTPIVKEIIIATSPSVDGEATAMYLARALKPLGVTVSRIATGLPVGGELEYSDQATIARALAGRARL